MKRIRITGHPDRRLVLLLIPIAVVSFFSGSVAGVKRGDENKEKVVVETRDFGGMKDGTTVKLFLLRNGSDMEVSITNYGGIVTSLKVPDRHGKIGDVVLGFHDLSTYLAGHPYFGALIGRYGNRIAGGKFELMGKEYSLAVNNGPNHLHGGIRGFDKAVWRAEAFTSVGEAGVRLEHISADGEEGYPGNLKATVVYTLTAGNLLRIEYRAETDRPTPVNLTHHSYFNLKGEGEGDILGHRLMIAASFYTPVDDALVPTGEILSVKETPMDFRTAVAIGAEIDRVAGGYDHNWVLDGWTGGLRKAAEVEEPEAGRVMEVWTTEPGLQFYAGNFLDGVLKGKSGKSYVKHGGFCLEAQHFPDSPNMLHFPCTILKPGDIYSQTTEYRFRVH